MLEPQFVAPRLTTLAAPFPYFGGKARIAGIVWQRLGDVTNYVEPFFGSGAMLLGRPDDHDWLQRSETVNDADGFVANFWRAVQADPDAVAAAADWPVNENDLHARHAWLVGQRERVTARLEGDPDYYDAKVAGWWVWGMCAWIGGGWCSGRGPWIVDDGELVDRRQLVHLGDAGQGINRQLVHLGDAGRGINRKRVHLGNAGQGINRKRVHVETMMRELQERLRRVRVCSGDWKRVVPPSVTTRHGLTGVFLDPPYADTASREADIYAMDSLRVAHDVRAWATLHGDDPKFRIALAGYEGEHDMPDTWSVVEWSARGGYGNQGNGAGRANRHRERIWFSPHCLRDAAVSYTLRMW